MTYSSALLTMFLCGFLGLVVPGAGYFTYLEYKKRVRRLPEATEFENLAEKIEQMKVDLARYEDKIREMQKDLLNRDYAVKELEACLLRKQQAESELLTLQPHLMELERVNQELASKTEDLAKLRQDTEQSKIQYEELQYQLKVLPRKRSNLEKEIEDLKKQSTELEEKTKLLKNQEHDLTTKISSLEASRSSLTEDIEKLKKELSDADKEIRELHQKATTLKSEISSMELTRAALEGAVSTAQSIKEESLEKSLEDLVTIEPACLKGRSKASKGHSETKALEKLYDHLEGLNLYYSRRVLKSFHTNLKISQISPMVALAGISGTGKSELPKRYSEAMGMHFLQVAVQPRWDSPQDLFGFYNYLEQRYKATELARSMVRLDPWNWPQLAKAYKDRILMVLLDEMNLARVEYYFSEFLSRLEGRKSVNEEDEFSRQPVEIELDLGRKKGEKGTKRVFPSQNVLFVGTMNEDESTQSMSDKVIDRAPVIRFARPKKLESTPPDVAPNISENYLPFSTWISWRRDVSKLSNDTMDYLNRWINRLNESLDTFGRPFGHRLNQAIIAYVANHPDMIVDETDQNARRAFADQLEQRIFPKLRGIEMDDQYNEKAYKDLLGLVREELHDEELARALERSIKNVLFSWVGLQREEEK